MLQLTMRYTYYKIIDDERLVCYHSAIGGWGGHGLSAMCSSAWSLKSKWQLEDFYISYWYISNIHITSLISYGFIMSVLSSHVNASQVAKNLMNESSNTACDQFINCSVATVYQTLSN